MDSLLIQPLLHASQYLVGLTLLVLALFSIYSLAVIGERWWAFRASRLASAGCLRRTLEHMEHGQVGPALQLCERARGGHVAAVLAAGLWELSSISPANPGLEAGPALDRALLGAREAMQRATAAEIDRLEQRLTSLATLGNISPFVGLFGTVIGVMRAFEAIAKTGSGGLGTVSAGIAEALVATAAGLFVAIPAVTAYNHFISRVKRSATEMDAAASELAARMARAAGSREPGSGS